MELSIQHQPQQQQFVTVISGKTAYLKYNLSSDGKTLDYYSTFVPTELRGHNIGREIVKFALDFAQQNNYQVVPSCPFVKQYIERYPEYKSLIRS